MEKSSTINDVPRKRGKHHPVAEKKSAIEKWKVSGLSKAEFCRQEGLSVKLFYSWAYSGNTKARKESSQEARLIPAKLSRSSKPETVLEPASHDRACPIRTFFNLSLFFKKLWKQMSLSDTRGHAMFSTQPVMEILYKNKWQYIIRLPKKKLTDFANRLNKRKSTSMSIPWQPAYRKRKQEFHWENNITYGYKWQLTIHLVACTERYEQVDKKTGEIVEHFSEHVWISSIAVNMNNVHELLNEGARKKELIEDSINTEKNCGYHYKHAFSYHWNAMKGFHYLMRLAHAINALSEFTKKFKHTIKEPGCSATLKLIKDTLFSPWLPTEWVAAQRLKHPQLRLQLE